MKDAVNVQLTSNNEMHLLSELDALSSLVNKTREQKLTVFNSANASLIRKQDQHEELEEPASGRPRKDWAQIKAEAKALVQAGKKMAKQ